MVALGNWWKNRQARRRRQRERAQAFDHGVEEIVDRVDPRLRGLSDYRSRLLPALQDAVAVTNELIDSLPAAVEATPARWSEAPLRSFFASPDRLRQTFEQSHELRDFLSGSEARGATEIYGMIGMRMEHKTSLQRELQDGIEREQQVVSISFSDHRLGALSTDPEAFQRALRRRILEEMALRAAQRIMGLTSRRDALAEQQAQLQWKRKIYQMRRDGIGGLRPGSTSCDRHIEELNRKIDDNTDDLNELLAQAGSIDDFLDVTVETFERIGETVRLQPLQLCLDHLNRECTSVNGDSVRAQPLRLAELRVGRRRPRVIQPVRFSPRDYSVDVGRALRRAARALGV